MAIGTVNCAGKSNYLLSLVQEVLEKLFSHVFARNPPNGG